VNGRALAVLALGVFAVAWSAPLIRLAFAEGAPALAVAALRLSFAAPVMIGLAAWHGTGDLRGLSVRQWGLLVLSGAGLALHFGFWVASLERTSVATSVVLVTTQPIFVSLGAWAFLGERPTRPVALGTAIAAAGAVVLVSDDWGDMGTQWGNLLALMGAMAVSVYVVVGRHARQHLSFTSYTATVYGVTAVLLLSGALVTGSQIIGLPAAAYFFIAAMAAISHLIGHNAINWSLATVPAAVVAVAILGEPAIAVVLSSFLIDEVPTLLELLGGAIVLAGVYVALRGARKATRPSAPLGRERGDARAG
jgi:drug/metabolite transporter (DMT)-like permease